MTLSSACTHGIAPTPSTARPPTEISTRGTLRPTRTGPSLDGRLVVIAISRGACHGRATRARAPPNDRRAARRRRTGLSRRRTQLTIGARAARDVLGLAEDLRLLHLTLVRALGHDLERLREPNDLRAQQSDLRVALSVLSQQRPHLIQTWRM